MSVGSAQADAKWIRGPADESAIAQGCYFDEEAADRPCRFLETFCRQSKGQWADQLIKLMDWQRDFVQRLYGWRRADGRRRFKTAHLEVPKKNGKSTLVSGLALYSVIADDEPGAEVYINAVDRSQARIVFDEAVRMVNASEHLLKRLDVCETAKRISYPEAQSFIQANSADVDAKDGANASHVIFDEAHRLAKYALWDVFEHAGASRRQPLRISITTAGDEATGVWFEQRTYTEQVNSGVVDDITHLGVIYRALETDDYGDPATWKKANPSLGITIDEEDFRQRYEKAKKNPREWANFLRYRLDVLIGGPERFIDMARWDACARERIDPATMLGGPCYEGLDLSEVNDLSAWAVIWGDNQAGYDVWAHFWLPEDIIVELEHKHGAPYRAWAAEGWLTLTPGNVVDYDFIRAAINGFPPRHDRRGLAADPYKATELCRGLKEEDGLPVQFIRQGFLSLSAPTKELERLYLSGKLRHDGNPILRWCADNAIARKDANDNVMLDKLKSRKKIDGLTAIVNALGAAMAVPPKKQSVYERRGVLTVKA